MKIARTIYNIVSPLLLIAYITSAIDHGDISLFLLYSSIIMTIGGIVMIATYDGPERTGLAKSIIGKPPQMARTMVLIYGIIACVMAFRALNMGPVVQQYMR